MVQDHIYNLDNQRCLNNRTFVLKSQEAIIEFRLQSPLWEKAMSLLYWKRRLNTNTSYSPVKPLRTTSRVCSAVRLRQGQALLMRTGSSKKLRANVR